MVVTGDNDWVEGYRKAVSRLLERHGTFVRLEGYEDLLPGTAEGDYDEYRLTYGWSDYDYEHIGKCGIKAWDYESLRERSLSQFQGTFTDNTEEVGMEMRATCNCGKFTNKWVRYTGSLGEALQAVLGG